MTALPSSVAPLPVAASSSDRACGRFLLLVAGISSFALLLPTLFAGPLVMDECGSYWIIDPELPGTIWERSLNYAATPPLPSWIEWASLSLFGRHEWALRLPSTLFAFAAVFVTYLAGRDLRNATCGGVASLIVAWHPEALDEVRIARGYGLVLFLSALLLWLSIRWWKSSFSLRYAALWGMAAVALLWTHYTAALLVLACSVSCLLLSRTSIEHRRATWTVAATLLCVAVLCCPLLASVGRLGTWAERLNYSASRSPWWHLIGPIWWAGLPAGLISSGLLRGRTAEVSFADRRSLIIVTAAAIVPLLILLALSFGSVTSLANNRYRVAYVPAASCLFAALITSMRGRAAAIAGAVATIGVSWLLAPEPPWRLVRLSNVKDVEWHEMNLHIAEHASVNEPILVLSGLTEGYLVPAFADDRLFMEYVACRITRFYIDSPHPHLALPYVWSGSTDMEEHFRRLVVEWADDPGGFWIAAATDTTLFQRSVDEMRLIAERAGYEMVESRDWPSADLMHYVHRSAHESASQ